MKPGSMALALPPLPDEINEVYAYVIDAVEHRALDLPNQETIVHYKLLKDTLNRWNI